MFLEMSNYPVSHRDCVIQAVKDLIPENEIIDLYSLYGITYDEYINDMASAYLRFKSQKVSEMWHKEN